MTGNEFISNVIIASTSSANAGSGYLGLNTPPNPALTQNNADYNYESGDSVNYSCSGGVRGANSTSTTQDNSSVYENSSVSGREAVIGAGSPVFNTPVSFSRYGIDFWGPLLPGPPIYLWETGTAPSNPH